jgi:DNA polymerase-3 subunit epsilon
LAEVKIIKGGWGNVPPNLKCRSELKEMGLVPKNQNKYVALVWNSYNWIQLYDLANCRPKRKPTEKQMEALRKGQEVLRKMLTCSQCGKYRYFKQNMHGDICINCHEENKWRKEQEWIQQEYENMIKEGEDAFKRWFHDDFIILDAETTGLYDAEIIELSIIDKQGNVLFDSLFKPKNPIPDDVIAIHGIDNEMVAFAPTWPEKWNEIKILLENNKILIYNAEFDMSMIFNTSKIWGIKGSLKINGGCVMEAYRKFIGSDRWVKLSQASGEYTAHRALNDCYSVLTLLNNVWSELGLIKDEKARI